MEDDRSPTNGLFSRCLRYKPSIEEEYHAGAVLQDVDSHILVLVRNGREDGYVLEKKIERVEVSIDGVLSTNITNTVPTTRYTDLYMQFIGLKIKLDQKCLLLYRLSMVVGGYITDG
ncbi:hypothetical protein M9H77_02955 [Catharanthus roseus]|uniref:Uncharacterized protein n=1 Tax=Catharanthus roseus TaxID=4058 RepID=A0ACC0C9V5_CATRO|nr:hypothetical protein M9H77_02955 [Catharanthus roseus]